ncbi:MAG: P-II family nitrogen regulator [Treponemataceae bacterium]
MKLIISIIPRNTGDILIEAANHAGARGGTILVGTGTSANSVIQLLGLGEDHLDLLLTVVDNQLEHKIIDALKMKFNEKIPKLKKGVIFSIDVTEFMRNGVMKSLQSKENNMNNENSYTMITAILNKGYAEDAMAAARNAGAKGGTILAAHGTAKEGDEKFFGVEIVPEKDMLLILVPNPEADSILNAIQNLECLKKAGSGIVFCTQADNFTVLGNNKQK